MFDKFTKVFNFSVIGMWVVMLAAGIFVLANGGSVDATMQNFMSEGALFSLALTDLFRGNYLY